jgi:hypothetical protein
LSFASDQTPITFAFDGGGNLFYVDLDSGALVATDPQGKMLARTNECDALSQWTQRPMAVSFTCLTTDLAGGILAVGPALDIKTLKIEADKSSTIP